MKKKTLSLMLLSALSLSNFSFAQNLVPNWSFEDTVSCPSSLNEIAKSSGWSAYLGSPDYFNSCNNSNVGIPTNVWGCQDAKSGNAYAGLVTYAIGTNNLREFIGVELAQSLVIGQKYYVQFFASKAVNSSFISNASYGNVLSNKLGLRLSTVSYSAIAPPPINNFANIFSASIVSDTLNWIKISGSLIADSAYKYLSIGNFFDDTSTNYAANDTNEILAYYYIDDVYLSPDSLDNVSLVNKSEGVEIFQNYISQYVEIISDKMQFVIIYDALGRICYRSNLIDDSKLKIITSVFKTGFYLISIRARDKIFYKKIFIP